MIWSVSWRNIWRNKTRSSVIISAIALGVFAGVYTIAFMFGWVNQRVNAVINTEISHIQIHHPQYIETNDVHQYIPNIHQLQSSIEEKPEIKAVTARILSTCMISSAETGSGVQLVGIKPEKEQQVTNLHEKIIEGNYFQESKKNQIVIGKKLADKLKVKLRSKVVITLTEMDGTLTGGAFRVTGIYQTANSSYDEGKAFVRASDLSRLIQIEQGAGHELAVLLKENNMEEMVTRELKTELPDLKVMSWLEIMPDMKMMNESMNLMMYVFVVIILLALGFGIVNTMLMVILERVKEIGMLMAVGMNKSRVFLMIVLETIYLSLTGGVVGIILALILTAITAQTGLDLSLWAEGLNSLGFDAIIYPEIGFGTVMVVTLMVMLTGLIAAIYPARKAIKLKPADALRIEM
ncbi:MAG: FtsX-like permease family protein [Bacteroidales bacterium]|jgi:ABC-type lipoprotein release transport system permease subunit|nr:FtsX-like permease family protein [Bacteroidales bacterium]